jgi:putative acetyltransferase
MRIRPERPSEFSEIYELIRTAFATARVSGGDEQNFVDRLRAGPDYIPELALVAEDQGGIIGHIMLTRTSVATTASGARQVLLLGPVCVVLDRRDRGVGARLIGEALHRARELGHAAVVLVGNPAYYARFGFRSSTEFGVANANGIPSEFVMALELVPGALTDAAGSIRFAT